MTSTLRVLGIFGLLSLDKAHQEYYIRAIGFHPKTNNTLRGASAIHVVCKIYVLCKIPPLGLLVFTPKQILYKISVI